MSTALRPRLLLRLVKGDQLRAPKVLDLAQSLAVFVLLVWKPPLLGRGREQIIQGPFLALR